MPHRVAHAKAYPFPITGRSYLFVNGEARPLPAGPDLAGRAPVIACGSNRSAAQLARKYAEVEDDVVIPVHRAWLEDFDSVYAAHITSYGSIAATLQHAPGARVEVSVMWLDRPQLARMHRTESLGRHYHYARLDGIALALEGGGELASAHAYTTVLGCLSDGRGPVGLAEIAAEGRPHPSMRQEDAQALAHRKLGGEGALDAFILENIEDAGLRRARETRLAEDAHPFAWPRHAILEA